jgi:chromosome segregation ATPase
MNEMKTLIKQLKSDLSKSNNRNIELSTLLESERSHYSDQKSNMESQIKILEAKLSERQQELIDCKQKFEAQLSSYDLNNRASSSSNKKLQNNVSDMYKRLETAEKEMVSLISDLTAIRKSDQDKAIALKVKEKMLADSQNSANSYKLKLSILESENVTLNERIASLEDSYHRLKEDRDFIEDQLQAKSGAEQDLVDLLAKIENNKTSISKLTPGNRRGRGVVNKRQDGKPATVFDSNVSESFDDNSNYYDHDDVEDEDEDGVEDVDELDEFNSFGAEFDSRSGKVVFNKQSARDGRRGGGGSVVDEEGVQSNSINEEDVIHRLFNKSVVCNKRKCRTHLNYLENELKLKDDIIAELKLVK